MKMASPLQLDHLPADPLLHILSYLDFRDLINLSRVSRRLNELSNHKPLWRHLCAKHWLLTEEDQVKSTNSWRGLFKEYYTDLGRYIQFYPALKRAWVELKRYLQQHCPRVIASLKDGTTEEELNNIEAQIGCKLPDDYRCSYRIHNGQKLVIPGLMGSMSLANHYRSEVLLDVETAAGGFQQRRGMRCCLPLTFCFHTGLSQYLALAPVEGRSLYQSFYPTPDQTAQEPSAIDMFITGSSFSQWFLSYVDKVLTGEYPVLRDQIFRYDQDRSCVATTGDISISVSTSFLPELSSISPPHFLFTYRIRIEMASTASLMSSCQLDSRYWKITSSDGRVEEVQGPGVVGEFPVMTPGKVHEYSSCTNFATQSGYMEGHYTFHTLDKEEEVFQVAIPRFHMRCLPFKKASSSDTSSRQEDQDDEDIEDDYGEMRGLQMPVYEGSWCPRHS